MRVVVFRGDLENNLKVVFSVLPREEPAEPSLQALAR